MSQALSKFNSTVDLCAYCLPVYPQIIKLKPEIEL